MTDVLIVGAGPAGLSAAISCAEHGLKVRVVDEFMKPGGRLLGQLHEEPDGKWWNGIEEAMSLQIKAQQLGVQIDCGKPVYDLMKTESGWRVFTTQDTIDTPYLILATGAAEKAVPIPGWTLPGVMSIGAAQVMTNVHRVRIGEKGIVIGVNVLSAAITRELQLTGVDVTQVVLPAKNSATGDAGDPLKVMQSLLSVAHLAPSTFIRFGSKIMKYKNLQKVGVTLYPKSGVKMWDIPVHLRKAATEIYGDDKVEGVRLASITAKGEIISGSEIDVPVDYVCISGGLYPLAELAAVAGCPFRYIQSLGGHVPLHNSSMQTPLEGLYVAGNITGIESAKVAMAQGQVAGLAIVNDSNSTNKSKNISNELQKAIALVEKVRQDAVIQFHPKIYKGRQFLNAEWQLK